MFERLYFLLCFLTLIVFRKAVTEKELYIFQQGNLTTIKVWRNNLPSILIKSRYADLRLNSNSTFKYYFIMKKLHLLFALLLAWLSVGGVWADKEIVKISKIIPISESAVIAFQRNKGKFHPLPISGHVRLYAKGTMTITPKPGYTFTKIDYAFVINTGSYKAHGWVARHQLLSC